MAYDRLKKQNKSKGTKTYLKILKLAAFDSEEKVNRILNSLLDSQKEISFEKVKELIEIDIPVDDFIEIEIIEPNLDVYDKLQMIN